MNNEKKKCCICGKEFTGWGNNPWPAFKDPDAVCCDECNANEVIPMRMIMSMSGRNLKDDE